MNSPVLIKENATLRDTIKVIFSQMLDKYKAVAWMLDEFGLRHSDPVEAARRIHYFTKANLRYKLDPKNWELVRSAAQSWEDRAKGVDCEDLTIFQASLMIAQGHGHSVWLTIVDLDNEAPGFEHIYPSLILTTAAQPRSGIYNGSQPMGLAFDSLLNFGQHPSPIYATMQLRSLGGIAGYYSQPVPTELAGLGASQQGPALRKSEWLRMANRGHRQAIAAIMPWVVDLKPDGQIVWKPNTDPQRIADLIDSHMPEGLGRTRRRDRDGNRNNPPKDKASPKEKPKRNLIQSVAMVAPSLIIGRNAFLAMVALNAFRLASHLHIIFLDPEIARKSKLDPAIVAKALEARPRVEKTWRNLGGDIEALKKAIAKGAHTDASKLSGLGDAGASAGLAATAVPILVAIVPIVAAVPWKDMGGDANGNDPNSPDGKKLDGKKLGDAVASLIKKARENKTSEQTATDDAITALAETDNTTDNTTVNKTDPNAPEGKSNTGLYIALVLGVLGLGGGIAWWASSNNSSSTKKSK